MKYKINLSGLRLILGLIALSTLFTTQVSVAEVSQGTMIEVFQRLDDLEKKTRELVGENEVLKHQLANLKKTQKEGFLNVDERMDTLRSQFKKEKPVTVSKITVKPATPTPPTPPTPPTKQVVAPAKKPAEVAKPAVTETAKPKPPQTKAETVTPKANSKAATKYQKETYQAAYNKMKKSPTAGTQAFKEYIKMQPDSPLAANAQYWIGEIMYSHNNYKGAVQEFIKVLQKHKFSDKAPDAAIKLGYSFVALKNWAYAKRTFNDVLKYFPKNQNAVALANKQLAKIKAAGH